MGVRSRIGGVAAVAASVLLCVACTAQPVAPSTTPTPTPSASASVAPSPTADPGPQLYPEGTAADNLPLFAQVTDDVWAGAERASGRAYIDALVAAGFPKDAMQVTADQTTIGNPADTIEFSVRWGEDCLLGQVGPEIGEAVSVVLPALADGRCLIGATRTIDW